MRFGFRRQGRFSRKSKESPFFNFECSALFGCAFPSHSIKERKNTSMQKCFRPNPTPMRQLHSGPLSTYLDGFPGPHRPDERNVRLKRSLEPFTILVKRRAASARQPQQRQGHFAAIRLFDLDIAGLLQSCEMAGQVAFVHLGFVQQIKEVAFLHYREHGHDHQPPGFMNDPVQFGNSSKLLVHSASGAGGCVCRMYEYRVAAPDPSHTRPRNNATGGNDSETSPGTTRAIARSPNAMKMTTSHFHLCSLLQRKTKNAYVANRTAR